MLEFTEELDPAEVPELLDVTEELLLASVDELDFAEDELFFDEDWALLLLEEGLDGSPPLRSEDDSAMELLVSFSGSTKLLLSSSPQAINDIVMANSARVRNLQDLIRSSSMQKKRDCLHPAITPLK